MTNQDSYADARQPSLPEHKPLRCIGRGGYGAVWLSSSATRNLVAVKVVWREAFDSDEQFKREFSAIQRYENVSRGHENVLPILHVGTSEENGFYYYVMPLADDIVERRQIKPEDYEPRTLTLTCSASVGDCVDIGLAIVGALKYLHDCRLVHRDVKPANIVFVHKVATLADPGLVAAIGKAQDGLGTPRYLPPDSLSCGTPSGDLYALGKVLYELNTGQDVSQFPELPAGFRDDPNRDLRMRLNSIVVIACALDPNKRYRTAAQLEAALVNLRNQIKTGRTRPVSSFRKGIWAIAAVGLVLLAILAVKKSGKGNEPEFLEPPFVEPQSEATSGKGQTVFHESFDGGDLIRERWLCGQTGRFSYKNLGERGHRTEVVDNRLLVEATAEHESGWSCAQDTWVDAVLNLRNLGDAKAEISFATEARNATVTVRISDGNLPESHADPRSIVLYSARGGNFDPVYAEPKRLLVEFFCSSGVARIREPDRPQSGVKLVDLSALRKWNLRFYVAAKTSAGFRPAHGRLWVTDVRIARVPERTGIVGTVTDVLTGRPVPHCSIYDDSGIKLGRSSTYGSFFAAVPSGEVSLSVKKVGFSQPAPEIVRVTPGRVVNTEIPIQRSLSGFGDVVSSFVVTNQHLTGLAASSKSLFGIVNSTTPNRSLVVAMEYNGTGQRRVATGASLAALAEWEGRVFGLSWFPGRIYSVTGGEVRLSHTLTAQPPDYPKINWPRECTFDGKRLWFVERSLIENRYGVYALDVETWHLVVHLPSQDSKLSGIAWDRRRLWVTSLSGRVFEVDPELAAHEGSLEAGTGREFPGFYTHLAFAGGFLWGFDGEMHRVCQIRLDPVGE